MSNKKHIPIIVEEKYTISNWCKETLLFLSKEAYKSKNTLKKISPNSIGTYKDEIIMILGSDGKWIEDTIQKASSMNAKTMLLCAEPMDFSSDIYCISPDRSEIMVRCIEYLLKADRKMIALFGFNEKATSDLIRKKTFLSYINEFSLDSFSEQDIYYNDGSVTKCFDSFVYNVKKYNAVICANDVVAIYLINRIKELGISVPEDMFVIGNGNTRLSSMVSPTLTTVTLNVKLVAYHAIRIYKYLANQKPLHSMHAVIPGEILVRESTAFLDEEAHLISQLSGRKEYAKSHNDRFYIDSDIKEFFLLEDLFNNCDDIDYKIILGLLSNKSHENVANELFISINTLQYRIKKMYVKLGISRWEQFVKLLDKYSISI